MRPCPEPHWGWSRSGTASQRSVTTESRLHDRPSGETFRVLPPRGAEKRLRTHLDRRREPRIFWGSEEPGAGCLLPMEQPQCLDPEG